MQEDQRNLRIWRKAIVNLKGTIAVIAVVSGLTHKRGERVNSAIYYSADYIAMNA